METLAILRTYAIDATYVSGVCQIRDSGYYEQMSKRWRSKSTHCRRSKYIILDTNVKYLLNRTHCVHENIFCIVSFRQFNWDLPVRYASIRNNIEILTWQRAMQISRKGKRKKESESKNLKNEMHGCSSMLGI